MTAEPEGGERAAERAAAPGRRRRDPWRTAFFVTAAAGLIGGAAWALLGPALLVVRQVEVTGATRMVPKSSVLAAAAIRTGSPLITVDTAAAAGRIERITQVETAKVSRAWPDGIVIWIRQRTPVFAIATPSGYQVLDEHGVVLSISPERPRGLPLLLRQPSQAGRLRGDPAVLAAGEVMRALPASLRREVLTVRAADPATVMLGLRGGITVSWGGADRATEKVGELRLLRHTKATCYDVSDPVVAVAGGCANATRQGG